MVLVMKKTCDNCEWGCSLHGRTYCTMKGDDPMWHGWEADKAYGVGFYFTRLYWHDEEDEECAEWEELWD